VGMPAEQPEEPSVARTAPDPATSGRSEERRARSLLRRLQHALVLAAPLMVVCAALVALAARGATGERIVATNLDTPLNSSGSRIVDLVYPGYAPQRIHEVAVLPLSGGSRRGDDSVRVQMLSRGRTQILAVRTGGQDGSRLAALRDVVSGQASLQVVGDRDWVDLGRLPAVGHVRRVQIVGLLPSAFAFARLLPGVRAEEPALVEIQGADPPTLPPPGSPVRYRVYRGSPAAPAEVLARLFFFVSRSSVLTLGLVVAVTAFAVGWRDLVAGCSTRAVSLLVAGAALLHASLLPPLQGADETSTLATVEVRTLAPGLDETRVYPSSLVALARALDLDRVQYHRDQPLPLANESERLRLSELLRHRMHQGVTEAAPPPAGAFSQSAGDRAPLFFALMTASGPLVRGMSVLDRIAVYRLLATLSAVVLIAAGAVLLGNCEDAETLALPYGVICLVPSMVIVVASGSNYATAIGVGSLLAGLSIVAILGRRRTTRAICCIAVPVIALAGGDVWPDFFMLGGSFVAGVVLSLLASLRRRPRAAAIAAPLRRRRVPPMVGGIAFLTLVTGVALFEVQRRIGSMNGPLWSQYYRLRERPGDFTALAAALIPLATALFAASCTVAFRRRSAEWHAKVAIARSALIFSFFAVAFAALTYVPVPYERVFLPFGELMVAHIRAHLASTFAWDQDPLGWKISFGIGGWHDVPFSNGVYAVARWLTVAGIIALPIASVRLHVARPRQSVMLLLISGTAATVGMVGLVLRHHNLQHPQARYLLPLLPLILLPLLVRARHGFPRSLARSFVGALALLQIWFSIEVVGARYVLSPPRSRAPAQGAMSSLLSSEIPGAICPLNDPLPNADL